MGKRKSNDSPPDDDRDLAYWEELIHGVAEASRQVDKLVTTLAAGALGLSIAFVGDVAPEPVWKGYLAGSWGALSLALALTLSSLVTAGVAHERILGQLRERTPLEKIDSDSGWARATRLLARLSIVALLVGVALLATFAWLNLGEGTP